MPITAIRENQYYIGLGKQTGWGVPSASTNIFWRWLDGTDANPEIKMQQEYQGDTLPFETLIYKESQHWVIKVKEYARPITAGFALHALLGSYSDSYMAPIAQTSLSLGVGPGATSIEVAANLGNLGTLAVMLDAGLVTTGTPEVVTLNLASVTGAGPYTYTLSTGAVQNMHLSNAAVISASTHTLTRQPLTYDPYTIFTSFNAAGNLEFDIQDCACVEMKITGEKGKPIVLEHTWYGSLATKNSTLSSPFFEGQNVIGSPGSPFLFYQGAANWLVDGLSTGNALTVTKFEIDIKNSTGAEDMQSEALNPNYFLPGNAKITGTISVLFQNYNQYLETYFGGTANTQDSYLVGLGSFNAKFVSDPIDSLALGLPYVNYTAAKITPKLDGKPLPQNLVFTASAPLANAVPFTATLTNTNGRY